MYRSSSKSKTLKLQRETVRILASSELSAAQGGDSVGGVQGPILRWSDAVGCVGIDPHADLNNVSRAGAACGPGIPTASIVIIGNPMP